MKLNSGDITYMVTLSLSKCLPMFRQAQHDYVKAVADKIEKTK